MKKRVFAGWLGISLLPVLCLAADKMEVKSQVDKINYSIGYQIGNDFQNQGWELNEEMMLRGIRDALNRTDPLIPPEEMKATLVNLKKKLSADQQRKAREADKTFLAENAGKEGVVILPNGVQYKEIKAGTGKHPTLEDKVTIRYKVRRADGRKSPGDQSESGPLTYPLKKALPGLQEALKLMKEGSRWQIVLPPGPALGTKGEALEKAGVIIYELELISISPGK